MKGDHRLPDDVNRWPRDPYRLLGIKRNVAARDVRLAYTRLIRAFKPETHPEQFRLIRQAYEQITGSGPHSGAVFIQPANLGHFQPPSEFVSPPSFDEPDDSDDERFDPSPRSMPADNNLAAIWKAASSGDRPSAYRQLVEYQQRHAGRVQPYAMLYWLLLVDRTLDAGREPIDWLWAGASACGLANPLRLLLDRELTLHPQLGLSPKLAQLVNSDHPLDNTAKLLEWRWASMVGRENELEGLLADVQAVQPRLLESPNHWLEVLLVALRHLAWLRGRPAGDTAFRRYRHELRNVDVLEWRLGSEMDRLDFNIDVARAATKRSAGRRFSSEVQAVLESYGRLPLARVRPVLLPWLARLAKKPTDTLQRFDRVRKRTPILLSQLVEIFDTFATYDAPPNPDESERIELTVAGFFNRAQRTAYEQLRLPLLEFCMREAVSPTNLASLLIMRRNAYGNRAVEWGHTIAADVPLRTVYSANRVLWC